MFLHELAMCGLSGKVVAYHRGGGTFVLEFFVLQKAVAFSTASSDGFIA